MPTCANGRTTLGWKAICPPVLRRAYHGGWSAGVGPQPVGSDEEAPLGDFIEDSESTSAESAVVAGFMHDDINRVLRTLDDREQTVVRLRYGLDDGRPRTLDEIGRVFGISRERVRQIERDSMAKLRVGDRSEVLRSYAS